MSAYFGRAMAPAPPFTGEFPTLSSAKFAVPPERTGSFPFSLPAPPAPGVRQPQTQLSSGMQQPLTQLSSGLQPPLTHLSSCAPSEQAQERSFDVRHSETFYGELPETKPQNLGQAYATVDLKAFCGQPEPPAAAAAAPAVQAGYSAPPRLQAVPKHAAAAAFAPPAALDGPQAYMEAKLKAKELQFQLKLELKTMEREGKRLLSDEGKLQRKLRAQADSGLTHTGEAQCLARSIVSTRKAIARLEKLRTSMQQVILQLTESIAAMSMRHCVQRSSEVISQIGAFSQMPELERAVQNLRQEAAVCARADGIVNEALRDRQVEEASAIEVQRVLEEAALDRHLALCSAAAPSSEHPSSRPHSAATVPQTVFRPEPPSGTPLTRLPSAASTMLPSDFYVR